MHTHHPISRIKPVTTWMKIPTQFWSRRPGWHLMTHRKAGKGVLRYFHPEVAK